MARRRAEAEVDAILVKVSRIGSQVVEVSLDKDSTVQDALDAAGFDAESFNRLRIAGEAVELEDIVEDGDILTVSGGMKGGNA